MRRDLSASLHGWSKTGLAGLMLALWIGLEVLAVSPQLHRWFHNDSGAPEHQCFIVQLNKGSLVMPVEGWFVEAPANSSFLQPLAELVIFYPSFDYRVSDSRAPPAISSSTAVVG
jgi:hypothetical protein